MAYSDTDIASVKNGLQVIDLVRADDFSPKLKGSDYTMNCPFHDEKTGSFTISPSKNMFYCFGCGEGGDAIAWLRQYRGMSFPDAMKFAGKTPSSDERDYKAKAINPASYRYSDPDPEQFPIAIPKRKPTGPKSRLPQNGLPKAPKSKQFDNAFDWSEYTDRVTPANIEQLATWRGLSQLTVKWLLKEKLIGQSDRNQWAFPVHNVNGEAYKAHIRMDKGWTYFPKDLPNTPLVIGNPKTAPYTFICESQWDAFAIMDSQDEWDNPESQGSYIITRGAGNTKEIRELLAGAVEIILVPQNDPASKKNRKTGLTPAEKWAKEITEGLEDLPGFKVSNIPEEHEDFNDWWKDDQPKSKEVEKVLFTAASAPGSWDIMDFQEILKLPKIDPNNMIGNRFLCRGASMVLSGQSGIGKSTLSMQWIVHLAAGAPFFGIKSKAGKVLVVQAENDKGDMREMAEGTVVGMADAFREEGFDISKTFGNMKFTQVDNLSGQAFLESLARNLEIHRPDYVFIDPILSFVGGDISLQTTIAEFFREGINPLFKKYGCVGIMIHHTGKPSKDTANKDMTIHDFAYSGIGSSDLTNWARAIGVLTATKHPGVYQFMLPKRGKRAGMVNVDGDENVEYIFLEHSKKGMCWNQVLDPNDDTQANFNEGDRNRKKLHESIDLCWPSFPVTHDKLHAKIVDKLSIRPRAATNRIGTWVECGRITRDAQNNYTKNY